MHIFLLFLQAAKNLRAGVTAQKYRKQIAWRRNKVHELLVKGHSQYEISNIMRISQSTISRDIKQFNPLRAAIRTKDDDGHYLTEISRVLQQSCLDSVDGLTELLKSLWMIIDSAKAEEKVKVKSIHYATQIYKLRMQLLAGQPILARVEEAFKSAEERNKEIVRREELLKKHLKKSGMTEKELDFSNTAF